MDKVELFIDKAIHLMSESEINNNNNEEDVAEEDNEVNFRWFALYFIPTNYS